MMKKLKLLCLLLCTYSFVCAQALPEKATDISPLLIGEKIPDAELINLNGEKVSVSKLLSNKLLSIIVVYRGGWCMYCNRHLDGLSNVLEKIKKLNYQLVLVTTDSYTRINEGFDKKGFKFDAYSDTNAAFIQDLGIAFKAPGIYVPIVSKNSEGNNKGILPVPSIFIVNRSGEILYEYINPNYKKRISNAMLLAVAKSLVVL